LLLPAYSLPSGRISLKAELLTNADAARVSPRVRDDSRRFTFIETAKRGNVTGGREWLGNGKTNVIRAAIRRGLSWAYDGRAGRAAAFVREGLSRVEAT